MKMKNLTISLPEGVLDRLRVAAAERKVSMNRFVGDLIRNATGVDESSWVENHRRLHREIGLKLREGTWNREEIYAERIDRVH